MASPATQEALASPSSQSSSFVDLPHEVQREIISHCHRRDLVCVALVSRHFRDLAAAQLYRDFEIVFPDEDNPQFDTPVDDLAGGFDTFVTSDYNYAQYLRSICMDTLYMGDKAAGAYRPYLANLSCGKFMNTLLLLTLRKSRALESFKWNIRVELSRPVYKELHQVPTLSHLHIRLQAGPSQYETPPPLPNDASQSTSPAPAHVMSISSLPPPPPAFGLIPPPPPQVFYVPASTLPPPPLPKPPRVRAPKKASLEKEPPTLSGFRKLKSLAVLDIDTLDIVSEIQSCVRNSAGTLSKLKLSFSEKLASSARKPSVDPEPEDSDQEDEMMPLPTQTHAQNEEMSGPARVFRAQEERKTQESVLGRIFDVESTPAEKLQAIVVDVAETKRKVKSDQEVVDIMKSMAPKVMGELNGTADFAVSQDIIDMIGAAAQKYIDEARSRNQKDVSQETAASCSGTSQSSGESEPSNEKPANKPSDDQSSDDKPDDKPNDKPDDKPEDNPDDKHDDNTGDVPAEASAPEVSLFGDAASSKTKEDNGNADPDDIDIEAPEEELAIDYEEPPASDVQADEPEDTPAEAPASTAAALADTRTEYGKALASLKSQKADYKALAEELEMFESQANTLSKEIRRWRAGKSSGDINNLADAESQLLSLTRRVRDMQKEISECQVAIECAETLPPDEAGLRKEQAHMRHMRDYVRETRGVALQSLGIYLIPVRASVLSRAVDLRVLRRLTLLNVGIQAPVWALLHKENKEAPLPLRKIFTDNVSLVFLNFVASLEELHELFLLERENKAKPESFAPRTQTTIDQIRRLALKKHMPKLQRLMIKNLADTAWDVNEKVILLLCRQGKQLEELACNMSIRAMHCLMQHIAGLTALRALHVVRLRNDDTCVWVMRETKRFLVDAVSHYPELRLDWLAVDEDDRVDRLVRVAKWEDKEGTKEGDKAKGKGKAAVDAAAAAVDAAVAGLVSASVWGPPGDGEQGAAAEEELHGIHIPALLAAGLGGDEGGLSSATAGGGGGSEEEGGSDSEEEEGEEFPGQKIAIVEGMPFCDVDGVRIFKKEVVAGRL